jgi:HD-GYP domain-containing protein (c-di-GMP phosphodiesterase class II)
MKDKSLYAHSLDTARVAVSMLKVTGLRLSESDVTGAAVLHDMGKLHIPVAVLNKRGKLNAEERKLVETHVTISEDVILAMGDPLMSTYVQYVLQHHEMPDGSGYPLGLHLEQIHPIARIINISDRFMAMRDDRPYRMSMPVDKVLEFLRADIELFFPGKHQAIIKMLTAYNAVIPFRMMEVSKRTRSAHEVFCNSRTTG